MGGSPLLQAAVQFAVARFQKADQIEPKAGIQGKNRRAPLPWSRRNPVDRVHGQGVGVAHRVII